MTRSVEELRRDSEQSRAQLAATVDRLREQIADTAEDIRYKVSPENIKAEVSGFISHKTHGWMDALKQQAMDNPMQAIAAGTAIAVPCDAPGSRLPAAALDDRRRPCPEFEDHSRSRRGSGGTGN